MWLVRKACMGLQVVVKGGRYGRVQVDSVWIDRFRVDRLVVM